MRAFLRLILASILGSVAAVPCARAFATLGHGRLIGASTLRADYDSNIFVNDSQVDDLVGTATGEVRYVREAGVVTFEAATGLSLLGFANHSDQNGIEPFVEMRLGYSPSDKTEARAGVSFRRSTIANETVNDRTKSNDFRFDGSYQHLPTEKLGFRLTAVSSQSSYLSTGYSNLDSYSVGMHAVHVYSPKLKLLAGIAHGNADTDSAVAGRQGVDGADWRYTVSAEGEFAAKITGEVSAGYARREFDGAGFRDTGTFYLATRFTWLAAEKTNVSLLADQNFGLSASDQSVKSSSLSVMLNQSFSQKFAFEGSAGIDRSSYVGSFGTSNRKDNGWIFRARLNYVVRDNISLDVSSGYRRNNSTAAVSDYDRFNFGAGVSFRF